MQYWAYRADDELGLRRDRPADSTLYLSRSSETGEVDLNGHLTAVDGEIVDNELKRLVRDLYLEDRRDGVVRTPAQRRAAALVRMAARSINATGATARPLFQVIAGDETARRVCQLASGHVVTPEDLEPHIDTAVMQSFLFDGPNTIVAVSKQRTFRGALRKAIQVRDRRCQHRSVCPNPAVDGDVDHRQPAARGGPTSQWNGRAECWPHNRNPELHDHDGEPMPEREITFLDEIRCRIRWTAPRPGRRPRLPRPLRRRLSARNLRIRCPCRTAKGRGSDDDGRRLRSLARTVPCGVAGVLLSDARLGARDAEDLVGVRQEGLHEPSGPEQRAWVDRYMEAFLNADIEALKRLLTADVLMEMPPMINWFVGPDNYGVFMEWVFAKGGTEWCLLPVEANGQPGFAAYGRVDGGYELRTLQLFTVTAHGISRNSVFRDFDVFSSFGLASALDADQVPVIVVAVPR